MSAWRNEILGKGGRVHAGGSREGGNLNIKGLPDYAFKKIGRLATEISFGYTLPLHNTTTHRGPPLSCEVDEYLSLYVLCGWNVLYVRASSVTSLHLITTK